MKMIKIFPVPQTHTEPEQHPEQQTHELDLLNVNRVRVLSVSGLAQQTSSQKQIQEPVQHIFCSANLVHQLDSSLGQIAASDAALVIELAKYLLDLSKEQVSGFADRVKEIAEESGFTPVLNQSSDVYAVFTQKKD